MQDKGQMEGRDKNLAAVCGLYCGSCSWYIATTEDPKRLKKLTAQFHYSEEEGRCYGCRSGKRLPYCDQCMMFDCAAERGIDFCSQCEEYPCDELKRFQSEMPHRNDLWINLERVKSIGYRQWITEVRENYTCPSCHTINSTYDLKCRQCGEEPSCRYVAKYKHEIEQYLKRR